ncbi:D-glycero-alpha-D-manno-heptose-7-phosphate kinase [Desulfosalsimonas propionicica]|uniref:D-glycero-alpha-D-manno-heptose-7-phosphate kinase n=1 Tax=Desulfosalsimonas propionicica TaxID=332175 RepID=A0A7W0C9K0_9BACT|nr:galactokinase [Desulfosalsimonas propionicica]MBA2881683.1 D-glycero-alpha-D-manno-heptose-7-phosphate kinase [Desulfosalsimonas propionicica]
MTTNLSGNCKSALVTVSAPCRVDLGGTLDISSLYYPLAHLQPCTFNIALDLRTRVQVSAAEPGRIRVSSRGFETAEFSMDQAPFSHPLGLVFAIAALFRMDGIHIDIDSASPPRSALGGSSVAAVALVAALSQLQAGTKRPAPDRSAAVLLAHGIEQGLAGVPCGMQDQLAAAYGGVNAWYWTLDKGRPGWRQQVLIPPENAGEINANLLVAYCGVPHESKDINGTWIRRFLDGHDRPQWQQIVAATSEFVEAFAHGDMAAAAGWMNRETELRRRITPHVVDEVGAALIEAAKEQNCGARFAGAGGGGCLWALGPAGAIASLRPQWEAIVSGRPDGDILGACVAAEGLRVES